jgi:hypothetical protein
MLNTQLIENINICLDENTNTKTLVEFEEFLTEVKKLFLSHDIVVRNAYTYWFSQGLVSFEELKHFAVQFSVFSNQFLVAQLQKMINANSLSEMRSAKEILANEIGVVFNGRKDTRNLSEEEKDRQGDPELVSLSGSIDGGMFYFRAAHFEWLLKFGAALGLSFNDMGKRRHASKSTLHFCDELIRVYGSEDANIASGASFAIENWAAAGFWQELEDGLSLIKEKSIPNLPLAFFTWHNRLEAQHASNTVEELRSIFFEPNFDREKFLAGGIAMLEALSVFWNGLIS